ncbi:hypothetical protein [Streptomyces sp. URMC 123]|uniref:hypothetical protein n=1 Tax=Streptomyces sp. URMC 123 TaxID=3423403 RepID=UPI003F1ADAF6
MITTPEAGVGDSPGVPGPDAGGEPCGDPAADGAGEPAGAADAPGAPEGDEAGAAAGGLSVHAVSSTAAPASAAQYRRWALPRAMIGSLLMRMIVP